MKREKQIRKAREIALWRSEIPTNVNDAYEAGFTDGAEWSDENPAWVSVKDRRPPLQEEIAVAYSKVDGWRRNIYASEKDVDAEIKAWGLSYWMSLTAPDSNGNDIY